MLSLSPAFTVQADCQATTLALPETATLACNTNRISPGSPLLSVVSFPSHWSTCSGFSHKWGAWGLCLPRYVAHMSFSSRRRRGLGRRGCRRSHSAPLRGGNAKGIRIPSREAPPGGIHAWALCRVHALFRISGTVAGVGQKSRTLENPQGPFTLPVSSPRLAPGPSAANPAPGRQAPDKLTPRVTFMTSCYLLKDLQSSMGHLRGKF